VGSYHQSPTVKSSVSPKLMSADSHKRENIRLTGRWAAGAVVLFWGCFYAENAIMQYMKSLSPPNPHQGFFTLLLLSILGIIWVVIVFIVWLILLIPWAIWGAIFTTEVSGHVFVVACVVTWLLSELFTRVDFVRPATVPRRSAAIEPIEPAYQRARMSFLQFFSYLLAGLLPTGKQSHNPIRKGNVMNSREPTPEETQKDLVETTFNQEDELPPKPLKYDLASKGWRADGKLRRMIKGGHTSTDYYHDYLRGYKGMWETYDGLLDARGAAEKKAAEILLERQRVQQQAETLAVEVAAKKREKSDHENHIKLNELELKKREELDKLEIERKGLENEELKAKIDLMKRPADAGEQKQGIDPFIKYTVRRITELDKLEKAREFLKSVVSPDSAEDVDVLCDEKREQILKGGRR
jgi:hypothetical protein